MYLVYCCGGGLFKRHKDSSFFSEFQREHKSNTENSHLKSTQTKQMRVFVSSSKRQGFFQGFSGWVVNLNFTFWNKENFVSRFARVKWTKSFEFYRNGMSIIYLSLFN